MSKRRLVQQSKRWIIKIGSALLTNNGKGLNREAMAVWVQQIAGLRKRGMEVVLVSSGAVAEGMIRLGWQERPKSIHSQQAAAAVGQTSLLQSYEQAFQKYSIKTAQILLVHDDLSHRQRYLNARSTLRTLLDLGVLPIINENDTVVTDEIRFGDNDTLAALVANLIEADTLCILTDQSGMYDADPRRNSAAKPIFEKAAMDDDLDAMAGAGGALGRGGMISKVRAARLAARSGCNTLVVGGGIENVIDRVSAGEMLGTLLYADQQPIAARKRWLAGQLQARGRLILDEGAVQVLRENGTSLLPVGVSMVEGFFSRGDVVCCHDMSGQEVARGLVNYNSDDSRKIVGQPSGKIEALLGYKDFDELIHRDNLVLV